MTVTVLGRDADGIAVAEHTDEGANGPFSIRFYLTPCCAADGKGGEYGIICRACHQPIDSMYGGQPDELVEVFGDGIPLAQFREAMRS